MSFCKRLLCLLTAALLTVTLSPFAAAENSPDEDGEAEASDEYSYTLDGRTWDELVSDFLQQYDPDGTHISLAYYNTVTGETHYVNLEKYFLGASFYKLPLCMLYMDQLHNGERTEDSQIFGYRLGELIRGSIVDSNNEYAQLLLKAIRKNKGYRRGIAEYVGVDPDAMPSDSKYWSKTYFNAEQMLSCLQTLYENPDRFQLLMDYMLEAFPEEYFRYHEQPVEVAHKYGYIKELGSTFVNDCGICYTEDPILLVMFTKDVRSYSSALPEFCTLMIEYAQASREQRLRENDASAP